MFRPGVMIKKAEEPIALYCAAKSIGSFDLPSVHPIDFVAMHALVPSFGWTTKPNRAPWPMTWPSDGSFETCVQELAALKVAAKAEPRVDVEGVCSSGAYATALRRCADNARIEQHRIEPLIMHAANAYADQISREAYRIADELRSLDPMRLEGIDVERLIGEVRSADQD